MRKILALSYHDFKIIFRDKVLMVILFIPLLMGAILLWGVTPLMKELSIAQEYYPLIVGLFSVVSAISPAYIISFIMLDEKDEGVLTVMRTMPLPPLHFIAYRILFVLVFGFLTALFILTVSALSLAIIKIFLIAVHISFIAPIVAVAIITYSKNKIEGLTFLKGINFLSILPILSFFSGTIGKVLFSIIPTFWVFHAIMHFNSNAHLFLYLIVGTLICIMILWFLISEFRKKVF
ncbi:MAG: hypothetical protein M3512_06015 [Bacteroidota bacterium]|nr:hypothetical protein [Bacteroidota bacterium]